MHRAALVRSPAPSTTRAAPPRGPRPRGWLLAAALGAALAAPAGSARSEPAADPTQACLADLDAAIGLVQRNYAGYPDKLARFGSQALAQAEHDARERI